MRPGQRGFVLMGLVVFLALAGLLATRAAESSATARRRAQEDELLWIGQQYQRALASYYGASPGRVKHLPVTLDELLLDTRFPMPVRHLRRAYADPTQPDVPWGIVRQGNQIIGVYSQSDAPTLRRSGFPVALATFEGMEHQSDWRFVFVPRAGGAPATPRPAGVATTTSTQP